MFDWNNNHIAIFLIITWETFWKMVALWRAAKKGDVWYFIPIFLINFFGIIPIFYLWRTKQLEEVVHDTLKFLRIRK